MPDNVAPDSNVSSAGSHSVAPIPFRPTLPALLHWLVESYGDRIQVEDTLEGASFRLIERRSALLARALLARGIGKGAMIGLMLPNGPDWVAAFFAIERIGATAVLMSTFAKAPEIAHMLRHGDVSHLICADRYLGNDYCERLEAALPGLSGCDGEHPLYLREAPALRAIWVWGPEPPRWSQGGRRRLESFASEPGVDEGLLAAIEAEVTPADRALIIYTSGVTAAPKAVVHTHGSVARHSWTMSGYMTFAPGNRLMTTQPLFWVGGLCVSLLSANLRGTAFVSPRTSKPEDTLEALRTRNITHLALWPDQMMALRAHPQFREEDLKHLAPISSIQWGVFGLAPAQLTPNALGMSETFGPHTQEYPGAILPPERAGAFGRRVGEVQRLIVDPETRQALRPGEEGEIWIRGQQLMAGFYKSERHEVFEPDGFYRTGDFGRIMADDYLYFTGRRTEMIKTSGANVAPREVELVLSAVPDVLEAAVLGIPDPKAGQTVVAAVVLRENAHLGESELLRYVRSQLSSYKVPKRVFFLADAQMPRTQSSKVDKSRLRSMLTERMR
jgi:acyl-CoA synthetase (AMP-forming)/AMP-acid ligase II